MINFVNLLDNIEWSDKDITNKTESMVAAIVSPEEERILNRKIQAMGMGEYVLDEEDVEQVNKLKYIANLAHQEGIIARQNMSLLKKVWLYETAKNTLFRSDEHDIAQTEITNLQSKDTLSESETLRLSRLQSIEKPTTDEIDVANTVISQADTDTTELFEQRFSAGISFRPNVSQIPPIIDEEISNIL